MTYDKSHEQILDTIGDPAISHSVYSRRDVLKKSGMGVAALALSGMPIGLALMTEQALAQGTGATAALQLAAKLEYLEAELYRRGLEAFNTTNGTVVAGRFQLQEEGVVNMILLHENAHVTLLKAALGGSAPAQPAAGTTYDFSGGSGAGNGPFANALGTGGAAHVGATRTEFFKLAQLLEDLGASAYKGQLANLLGDANLTKAMQIHSVEARHSAEIRIMRNQLATAATTGTFNSFTTALFPWSAYSTTTNGLFDTGFTTTAAASGKSQADIAGLVYGPATPAAAGVQAPSLGEDNLVQKSSMTTVTFSSAFAEPFDEPVTAAVATTVAAFFGVA